MHKLAKHLTLAAVVTVTSMLWVEPAVRQQVGNSSKQTIQRALAQRYPVRSRSNNFFNRSKISSVSKATARR